MQIHKRSVFTHENEVPHIHQFPLPHVMVFTCHFELALDNPATAVLGALDNELQRTVIQLCHHFLPSPRGSEFCLECMPTPPRVNNIRDPQWRIIWKTNDTCLADGCSAFAEPLQRYIVLRVVCSEYGETTKVVHLEGLLHPRLRLGKHHEIGPAFLFISFPFCPLLRRPWTGMVPVVPFFLRPLLYSCAATSRTIACWRKLHRRVLCRPVHALVFRRHCHRGQSRPPRV